MILSRLFWSKCRVKILEKLIIGYALTKIEEGFFIRELCRDIDEQINSVRRELINLEDLGILKSRENNKKKFYTLNTLCPIYQELTSIFLKTYNPLSDIEAYFKGRKHIEVVAISEAITNLYTQGGIQSIVDIFIIWEIEKIEFNLFLEKVFFGRKIKYAVMSMEDFENRMNYSDKLVISILKQKWVRFIRDKLGISEKIKFL